jgi:hypothetical protein
MLTDTLVFLSTGAEAEGSEIPSAVPVEDVAPETQEATVEAPSRWRWPPEKLPRRQEEEGMTQC